MVTKILNKYKEMSVPIKAALWFTVCSFLQRGVSMITTPIFTRMLSTEEYGLYSTYLSWENVLLMVVSLCLYKSIMNLYIKYDDQERVLSAICGLELLLSVIWFLISLVLKKKISVIVRIIIYFGGMFVYEFHFSECFSMLVFIQKICV